MNTLLYVGLEIALRPLDAQLYAQSDQERPFGVGAIKGDHLADREKGDDIKIIVDSVLGYGRRCALVQFHPGRGASERRQVFAKVFWQQTAAQSQRFRQELGVLLDERLDAFRIGRTTTPCIQPTASSDEIGHDLRCFPRLLGLYGVRCESASTDLDRRFEKACILLLEPIPPTFQPLHMIEPSFLHHLGSHVTDYFRNACLALKLLHQHGYVHGDISRGNFLLSTDEEGNFQPHVLLVDFERSRNVTVSAMLLGEAELLMKLFVQHGFSKDAIEPILRTAFPRNTQPPSQGIQPEGLNQT